MAPPFGLAIVGLGASLAPLDIAVNVALPAITAHFRLALGDVQWLVICYVLVYGSLMLVCGKLGDLFGYRLIFRFGLLRAAYTRETLEAVVARSRFGHGEFIVDGIGFELRLVKHTPA